VLAVAVREGVADSWLCGGSRGIRAASLCSCRGRGRGSGEWELGFWIWEAAYIRFWWAFWANILVWASFSLLYTYKTVILEVPNGNGDEDLQNVLLSASSDGDGYMPNKLPTGTKNAPIASPNGGNPRRGSGPVAIPTAG
jgi:hypothetical protein